MLEDMLYFDSKGIFPTTSELETDYLERASFIADSINNNHKTHYVDSLAEMYAKKKFRENLRGRIDQRDIQNLSKKINDKYMCDLSWLIGYYVDLDYDPFGFENIGGQIMYAFPYRDKQNNIKQEPPFIFINTYAPYPKNFLLHEMLHAPRVLSKHPLSLYARERKSFEEQFANSMKGLPNLRPEYNIFKINLKKAFGSFADYVFIRLNYDELREYAKQKPEDIISWVDNAADTQTKFKIIKHKIGL